MDATATTMKAGKPGGSVSKMIYYITRSGMEATTGGRAPIVEIIKPVGEAILGDVLGLTTTTILPSISSVGGNDISDNRGMGERSPVTGDYPNLVDYYSHDPALTGYGLNYSADDFEPGGYGVRDQAFYCYGREHVCNPVLMGTQPCVVYGKMVGFEEGQYWVESSVRVMQILVPILIATAFLCMLAVAAVIFARRKRETGSSLNVYLGGHAIAALCYLVCAGVLHYLMLSGGGGISLEYYARRRQDLAILNSVEQGPSSTLSTPTTPERAVERGKGSWWLSASAAKLARLDVYFVALSEAFWLIAVYTLLAAGIDRCCRWKRRASGDGALSVRRCTTWAVVWTVVAIYVFGLASALPRIWMAFEPWRRRVQVYGRSGGDDASTPRYYCRMYDWYGIVTGFVVPIMGLFLLSSFLLNVLCRDRRALRNKLKEYDRRAVAAQGDNGGVPLVEGRGGQPYILDSDERDPMVFPVAYTPSGNVITPLRRPPPPPSYYHPSYSANYQPAREVGESDNLVYANDPRQRPAGAPGYGRAYNYNHNNSNERTGQFGYDEDDFYDDYQDGAVRYPGATGSSAYYDVSGSGGERGILREANKSALTRAFWSRARTTFALAATAFLTPLLFGPFSFSQIWINRVQDAGPTPVGIALSQIFQAAIYFYFVLHALALCFYDRFRRGAASLCCRCSKATTSRTPSIRDVQTSGLCGLEDGQKGEKSSVGKELRDAPKKGEKRRGVFSSCLKGKPKEPAYVRTTDEEDGEFLKATRPITPMTDSMLSSAGGAHKASPCDTTVILTPGSSLRATGVMTQMTPSGGTQRLEGDQGGGISTFRPPPEHKTTQILLLDRSRDLPGGGMGAAGGHDGLIDVKLLTQPSQSLRQVEEQQYRQSEPQMKMSLVQSAPATAIVGRKLLEDETKFNGSSVNAGSGKKKKNKSALLPCFGKVQKAASSKQSSEQEAKVAALDQAKSARAQNYARVEEGERDTNLLVEGAIYNSPLLSSTLPVQTDRHGAVKEPEVVVYRSTTTTLTKVPKGLVSQYERIGSLDGAGVEGSGPLPRRSVESGELDEIDDYIDSSGEHTRTDIGEDDYHYGTTPVLGSANAQASDSRIIGPNLTPTSNKSTAKIRYENVVYNTSSVTSATRYDIPSRPNPFCFPGSTEASAAALLKSPYLSSGSSALYSQLRQERPDYYYSSHSGYGH